MEKRLLNRFGVRLPVEFLGDLIDGKGLVVNLSTGGCGLQCEHGIHNGTYLNLLLQHPRSVVPIKIEVAVVRWIRDSLIGLEFIRVAATQQQRLRQLITLLEMGPEIEPPASNPIRIQPGV